MGAVFKSSDKRLVDFFKQSRDNWKDRSAQYQREKRLMVIQVRDLRRSKEKWKSECVHLRKEVDEMKKKLKKAKELSEKILNL